MGPLISCCLGESICCALGSIQCCCCSIPWRLSVATRIWYCLGFILATGVAWLLEVQGSSIFRSSPTMECDAICWNYLAVARISFGMALYHLLLSLILAGVSSSQDPRSKVQNGMWPIKFLLFSGTITGCFFINNSILYNYWIAALVFSTLFILIQSVILVDFAHTTAETWIANAEENGASGVWNVFLAAGAFLLYSGVAAGTGLLYIYYTQVQGCQLNTFFITLNLLLCITISIVSLLPKVQDVKPSSGLFQPALLSIYNTYLIASAVINNPHECNSSVHSTLDSQWTLAVQIIGAMLTLLALGYSAVSCGSSDVYVGGDDMDDEQHGTMYNYTFFHFAFFMASFYMSGVVTNWSTLNKYNAHGDVSLITIEKGDGAMWVKVVTSWVNGILYIWTLTAPILMPDRDFGQRLVILYPQRLDKPAISCAPSIADNSPSGSSHRRRRALTYNKTSSIISSKKYQPFKVAEADSIHLAEAPLANSTISSANDDIEQHHHHQSTSSTHSHAPEQEGDEHATTSSSSTSTTAMDDSAKHFRVKVYELSDQGEWVDKGTGQVETTWIDAKDGVCLLVRSEDIGAVTLNSKIRKDPIYQRQQETLIVWTEPNGTDLALSFQEASGCQDVWEAIEAVQKRLAIQGPDIDQMPASTTPIEGDTPADRSSGPLVLPSPTLGNLKDAEQIVTNASRTKYGRDQLLQSLHQERYLEALLSLLAPAEDMEMMEELFCLSSIVRMVIFLNESNVYDYILQDEVFEQVAGVLECKKPPSLLYFIILS
ncbi:hypothetical protein SeMB42_g04766 [Synchytrium endobioticum]|uniref:Uncharacterized protein n=1 Tax=Synchytrium endobioticum TaxID=286115 RepID=A0A507CVW7_9FUNG|nr:hypothetical protein SeMB42_g04766 [Synchytrium endobioticum]